MMLTRKKSPLGLSPALLLTAVSLVAVQDSPAQEVYLVHPSSVSRPTSVRYAQEDHAGRRYWSPSPGQHLCGQYVAMRLQGPVSRAFSEEVLRIRAQAQQAVTLSPAASAGWSLSKADPMIVAVFPSLRIKSGFVLRGYECAIGSNSSGVVWAIPAKVPCPGQNGEPIDNGGFDKPDEALDDLMDAVEGDGSPRSYVCASILSRELDEFGARWHGQNWVTHTILTANPWKSGIPARHRSHFPGPSPDPNRWEWLETEPKDWRPSVTVSHDSVTVTFFTYSPLGQEAIYRHVDCFVSGSYRFTTERTVIARGPQCMVF